MYHMYSLILTLSTDVFVCVCVCVLADFRTIQSEHEHTKLIQQIPVFLSYTVIPSLIAILEQSSIILIK